MPSTEQTTLHERQAADELSIREIARLGKVSLVVVNTGDGFGTGFAIGDAGSVVTNYHVVQGADRIGVEDLDGRFYLVTAVRAFDEDNDLAILEVPTLRLPGLPLASELPEPGDSVVVLGHPKGLTATVSDGLVAAVRDLAPGIVRLQFTAPIATGSSGGPLLNRRAEVVGVVAQSLPGSQNLNFAATVQALARLSLEHGTEPLALSAFAAATRAEPMRSHAAMPRPLVQHGSLRRPSFPGSVAGFSFGMTPKQAAAVCTKAHPPESQLRSTATETRAECPFLPMHARFEAFMVVMEFAEGKLDTLVLHARSLEEVSAALSSEYGDPDVRLTFDARSQSWDEALPSGQGIPGGAKWHLAGGEVSAARFDGTSVVVRYRSDVSRAEADQKR